MVPEGKAATVGCLLLPPPPWRSSAPASSFSLSSSSIAKRQVQPEQNDSEQAKQVGWVASCALLSSPELQAIGE